MIATAMHAAINPYSIAVAPESSLRAVELFHANLLLNGGI
jgi:hypothetical protein